MVKQEDPKIVRAPAVESVLPSGRKKTRKRLSSLRTPGRYFFALYSGSNPIPFFPKWVEVTREKISKSTLNNERLGSVFNNWSLSTVFDESDRSFLSIEDVRKLVGITKEEFEHKASRYFFQNGLTGNAKDITTWKGLVARTTEVKDQDLVFALRGLFRAAGKSSSFCVLRDIGIVALRHVEVAKMRTIKLSLDKLFIAMNISTKVSAGVAVPALHRAFLFYLWLVSTLVGQWRGENGKPGTFKLLIERMDQFAYSKQLLPADGYQGREKIDLLVNELGEAWSHTKVSNGAFL